MIYEQLEGFFNWQFLYDQMVEEAKDGDFIVEIGTWEGRSAVYLAEKIKQSGKVVRILCFDPYIYGLIGNQTDANEFHRLEKLRKVVEQNGLSKILFNIISKSSELPCILSSLGDKVFAVFIDGDHSYEVCKNDIVEADIYVRDGGIIAGHDYTKGEWQGVVDAVDEYFGKDVKIVDNVWIHRKLH